MSCENLCTAAKCAELGSRIDDLTAIVQQLRDDLNSHALQLVSYSHDYIPNMAPRTAPIDNKLTILFNLEGFEQRRTVTFPDSIIPNVTCDIFPLGNGSHVIKVAVNGKTDEDTLYIEEPQLDFAIAEILPGTYDFEITLGDQLAAGDLVIPLFEPEEMVETGVDFNIDVSYLLNFFKVAVTVDGVTKSD